MIQRKSKWLVAGAAARGPGHVRLPALRPPPRRRQSRTSRRASRPPGSVAPQFLANASTIPHWTFQYTDPTNGVTYPITMVGSDPRGGGSTAVHTVIVPLKLNFVAGGQDTSALNDLGYTGFTAPPLTHTFDGGRRVNDVLNSPIFSANYTTPVGDGRRHGPGRRRLHAGAGEQDRLGLPRPTDERRRHADTNAGRPGQQGPRLPAPGRRLAWGATAYGATDTITGVADSNWFSSQLQQLMNSLHISATTVPIFLTDNVLLYSGHEQLHELLHPRLPRCRRCRSATVPARRTARASSRCRRSSTRAWTTPGTYSGFLSDYTGHALGAEPGARAGRHPRAQPRGHRSGWTIHS